MADQQGAGEPLGYSRGARAPWFSLSVVLITTVAVGAIHFGIFVVSGFLATGSHTSLPCHGVAETIWQITRFPATPLRRFLYSTFALQNNLGIGLFIFNSLAWGLAVGMVVSWLTRSMRLPRG